jgi:hypothetical protein
VWRKPRAVNPGAGDDGGVTDVTSDDVTHLSTEALTAGLEHVRRSPADLGTLELIVARPDLGAREVLGEARLDEAVGLEGDNWLVRGSRHTDDGSAEPLAQLNIMNSRAVALVSPDPDRRALAGDQLYLDLDLSPENLPPGTRLAIGDSIIEVNDKPHRGCAKFTERFGIDAARFVNSPAGTAVRLRGICATVVRAGVVRQGDTVRKV